MPLEPGTRLGPYQVVAPLGSGGMSEVYRARDTRLGREVAIKALPAAFAGDPARLARFEREAQTLAALNHPNIGAIYGLDESTGGPHLVLELVDGETLGARLGRGALAPREALRIGVQIAAAIEAAHERGIVHRDLKPGNVMLTGSGLVKVLDFGLAKSGAALEGAVPETSQTPTRSVGVAATMAGAIVGTAAYMSPEQARGREVDGRSDVWSFGCVLFECLAGRPAFSGDTVSDLIARILEREPVWEALPAGTPARAREILRRCLRKDADERPRDMRDVRLELSEIAETGVRTDSTPERSIAVLPFDNLSGPDDEYFADGVTDEILNALTQVEGLRVAARTSCFTFKGKREDLRTVGERLDVATVLEGSVRRSGSRLRITVQLVNAADGYQLWSERYDRELTDVFEVQDEIAGAIASRLRGALRTETERRQARSGTKNLEAYEMLLKGRALLLKRGRFLPEGIACVERAIALDPDYAQALAWLADSYRLKSTFGNEPFGEVMPKARQLAERAIAIDPGIADAWGALACVAEQYEWDFARGQELWDRTLAIDPRHSRSRTQRALWALALGRWPADRAVAETERAVADDPLNDWVIAMHSHVLGFAGRYGESLAEAERAFALDPDSFFSHWSVVRAHAWAGHHAQAIEMGPALLRVSGRHPWALGSLAWAHGKLNRPEIAGAIHDELMARSRQEFMAPNWLAITASVAGRPDVAIQHLERAVRERDPLLLWSRGSMFWDTLRADPRFAEVTREVWSAVDRVGPAHVS
jgi:serine/threonine-protein kinase